MVLADTAMIRLNALQCGKQLMAAHLSLQLHYGIQEVRRAIGHAPCGSTVQRRNTGHLRAGQCVDLPHCGP